MKRSFDITLAFSLTLIFLMPMVLIAFLIRLSSPGPVIFWSERVGINNKLFRMPKFRTMTVNTPSVATHLLTDHALYITSIGNILRKTSLDELPQLWSIMKGDMSFVGPRPALISQYDLIELRTINGVHKIRTGLTGWAQVNGRDDLSIREKVAFDTEYLQNRSFFFDLKIFWMTFIKVIFKDGVSH